MYDVKCCAAILLKISFLNNSDAQPFFHKQGSGLEGYGTLMQSTIMHPIWF